MAMNPAGSRWVRSWSPVHGGAVAPPTLAGEAGSSSSSRAAGIVSLLGLEPRRSDVGRSLAKPGGGRSRTGLRSRSSRSSSFDQALDLCAVSAVPVAPIISQQVQLAQIRPDRRRTASLRHNVSRRSRVAMR
jgi:hypothetical protein